MRYGIIILLAAGCASAQPVIESVLNAANKRVSPVNPQMLVSIRGQNLAGASQIASGYPLPYQLGGTSVTINGIAAPLLYVSPDQINAQVPSVVKRGSQVQVVVRTGAADSAPFTVTTAVDGAPGIFTRDVSGCGQGVVFNVHADGATDQNSPENSFDPMHDWGVMILGTGLYSSPTRKDGEAWQFDGQLGLGAAVQAFLGFEGLQHPSAVQATYAGPMPGTAGVDQINVPFSKDPTHIPRGCRVPLWFRTIQVNASQYVNISVADGGGSCSDPTPDALASVTIQTTHTSGISGSSAAGSIDAQFIRGPSLELPSGAPYGEQWGTVSEPPSYCAASFPETLGAGTLSVSSDSFGTLSLEPRTEERVVSYHADLPPATSLQGRLTITASGGSVDAFTASEEIPPPIQILTQFPPGMSVAPTQEKPFTVMWSGGDARSRVTVEERTYTEGSPHVALVSSTVQGDAGAASVRKWLGGTFGPPGEPPPLNPPNSEIRVVITQEIPQEMPPRISPGVFNVPGLTLGGKLIWKYVWEFRDLRR